MLLATMLPQVEIPVQLTFFVTNLDCFGDFFRGFGSNNLNGSPPEELENLDKHEQLCVLIIWELHTLSHLTLFLD
jgi:hypothetical protein